MFLPFSPGKNQNRTVWSENKIRWRNYCKVRIHCFPPISSFRVLLLFLFCISLLEMDKMGEVQESTLFWKHCLNLVSCREFINSHVFLPNNTLFLGHMLLHSWFNSQVLHLLCIFYSISHILFRNWPLSGLQYFLWFCSLAEKNVFTTGYPLHW